MKGVIPILVRIPLKVVRSTTFENKYINSSPLLSTIPSTIYQQVTQYHSSSKLGAGFADFFDPPDTSGKPGAVVFTGRGWTVPDLRRKSFDDLHKLWYVLYKERNVLLTSRLTAKRFNRPIAAKDENRYISVKRSMAGIKCVLGERKKIDDMLKSQQEKTVDSKDDSVNTPLP